MGLVGCEVAVYLHVVGLNLVATPIESNNLLEREDLLVEIPLRTKRGGGEFCFATLLRIVNLGRLVLGLLLVLSLPHPTLTTHLN